MSARPMLPWSQRQRSRKDRKKGSGCRHDIYWNRGARKCPKYGRGRWPDGSPRALMKCGVYYNVTPLGKLKRSRDTLEKKLRKLRRDLRLMRDLPKLAKKTRVAIDQILAGEWAR